MQKYKAVCLSVSQSLNVLDQWLSETVEMLMESMLHTHSMYQSYNVGMFNNFRSYFTYYLSCLQNIIHQLSHNINHQFYNINFIINSNTSEKSTLTDTNTCYVLSSITALKLHIFNIPN